MFSKSGILKNSVRSVPNSLKEGINKKGKQPNSKEHKINPKSFVPKNVDIKEATDKSLSGILFGAIASSIKPNKTTSNNKPKTTEKKQNIVSNDKNKQEIKNTNKNILDIHKEIYAKSGISPVQGINTNGASIYFQESMEDLKEKYAKKNNYQSNPIEKKETVKKDKTTWEQLKETTRKSLANSKNNLEELSWEQLKETATKSLSNSKNNFINNMEKIQDKDIPIISNFTAGLYNLELDEGDSGIFSNAGAVVGGACEWVGETISGIYSVITSPGEFFKGLETIISDPMGSIQTIYNEEAKNWENYTKEEKFRNGTKIGIDIITSIPSGGGAAAVKGVGITNKAGNIAKVADKAGDIAKVADKVGDIAKVADKAGDIGKVVDKAGDIAKVADKAGDIAKVADKVGDVAKVVDKAGDTLPNKKGGVNIVIEEVKPVNKKKIISNDLRKTDINEQIKGFDPAKAKNLQKGNYGEFLTELEMYEMGDLENIMLDSSRLKTINDPTHQGIDLIFKNNTPPPEIVIVESKYKNNGKKPRMNKNRNKNTKDKWKRQMDDNWIDKNLKDAVGDEKAEEIRELLEQDKKDYKLNGNTGIGNVLKLASLIDQTGNVRYFEIGRKGEVLIELSRIEVEQILKN